MNLHKIQIHGLELNLCMPVLKRKNDNVLGGRNIRDNRPVVSEKMQENSHLQCPVLGFLYVKASFAHNL